MSEQDNAAVVRQFKQLYLQQKEYAQALALLQREPYRFSLQGVMYQWKMCVAALVNDPDQAIQAFREALERGYSYPGPALREDADLASLQGMPAYEELVRLSLERFAAAETKARPELLIIPPAEQHADRVPLLLGLHGDPQNARLAANDWQPIAAKGWLVACAQSSQLVTSDSYIWDDLARGTTDVQNLYKTLNTRDVIDAERVVLGGMSTGGALAIHMAVTGAIKTRGFFVVGPYLRDLELEPLTPYLDTAAASGVRGYIVMGLQDQPEAQEMMRKIDAFLNTHGIPCKIEERPELADDFPADFEHSIDKALAFLGA